MPENTNELLLRQHDCWEHSHVDECDGEKDKCHCRICGRIFETPCNFDEDMS